MQVGIDFDNTIVSYDRLFHRVAVEKDLVPEDLPVSKLAVRDVLREVDREDVWTEMQGYVYGRRMAEAEAFPGVLNFLGWAREVNISVAIISHKTRYPFLGPRYDLHESARKWVENVLQDNGTLVSADQIFFEQTKQAKLRRIGEFGCAFFIDDLPEILLDADFPDTARRILFDPECRFSGDHAFTPLGSWEDIRRHVGGRWTARS